MKTIIFLLILLALGASACAPKLPPAVPTVEPSRTAALTSTSTPTGTPTRTPTPPATATSTVTPTLEPRLPSAEPPVVSPGAVLSPENAGRVVELAGWGEGYDFNLFFGMSKLAAGGSLLMQTEIADSTQTDAGSIFRTRFWDLPSGKLRLELIHPQGYGSIFASPDGTRFAIYQNYCQREDPQPCLMEIWSFPENELLLSFDPGLMFNAAFSPDDRLLAVSTVAGIALWDLTTGKLARTLSPSASYDFLAFSPDNKLLAGTQNMGDGTVGVWQVEDGQLAASLVSKAGSPGYSPNEMAFSPDSATLVLVYGGTAVPWKTSDWSEGPAWVWDELNGITQVVFSPDGRLIAAGGGRGSITLADAATGKVLVSWDSHSDDTYDYISDLVFSPDGRLLISQSMDMTLRFWGNPAD